MDIYPWKLHIFQLPSKMVSLVKSHASYSELGSNKVICGCKKKWTKQADALIREFPVGPYMLRSILVMKVYWWLGLHLGFVQCDWSLFFIFRTAVSCNSWESRSAVWNSLRITERLKKIKLFFYPFGTKVTVNMIRCFLVFRERLYAKLKNTILRVCLKWIKPFSEWRRA